MDNRETIALIKNYLVLQEKNNFPDFERGAATQYLLIWVIQLPNNLE